MSTGTMIATIMAAAADMISHVVELASVGKASQAQAVVDRFDATTQAQLNADRAVAEDILRRRFPSSQPPKG